VHKSNYKQIALAVCIAFLPLSAHSAGLGKLTVISGLGEPLRAEIDLVSTTPEELSSLTAAIAPQEAYAVQGMERRAIHNLIQVEVDKKPDGSPVLKLATRQPVEEPFLDMLIQVDWATGRLLREYTVLLDPPGYNISQPVIASIPAPSQMAAEPPSSTSAIVSTVTEDSQPASTTESQYTTKPGDTLSKIARQMKVEGVNLDQMLVGLYRANQDAFDGGNMNRLKVGQIIKAPTSEELADISPREAAEEIKVQSADWNAYRNRLASIVAESGSSPEDESGAAASGRLKTAAEDKAIPAETGPRDVVKLSKSESDLNEATQNLQAQLAAEQEEGIAKQKSIEEANERIAMLEKQIADLQALLTLKSEALSNLNPTEQTADEVPVSSETDTSEMTETSDSSEAPIDSPAEVNAETAENTAQQPKPAPVREPVAPAPASSDSLLDELTAHAPLLGLAGGAILLLGGGWLVIRNRRKKNLDSFEQSILTAGGLKANTVFGNTSGGTVDTGDTSFLTNFSQSPSGMIDTHDVDPIAEAEVYMAYGRDSQAEEILNDAIAKDPTRYELHLKLLEIFAARNDTSAFEAVAGELYSTLGSNDSVWKQVAEMGHKLEPNNPLYDTTNHQLPPAVETSTEESLDKTMVMSSPPEVSRLDASDFEDAEVMTAASLDFSLEDTPVEAAEVAEESTSDSGLDFDLGMPSDDADSAPGTVEFDTTQVSTNSESEASVSEMAGDAGLDFNMDFSLGEGTDQSETEQVASSGDESLTASADTIQFETQSFAETLPETEASSFNLGLEQPTIEIEEKEASITQEDAVDFSFSDTDTALASEGSVEPVTEEVSTLDISLDTEAADILATNGFSVSESENEEQGAETADSALELDLSGISLDLGGDIQESNLGDGGQVMAEPEEVDTKLDLVTAYLDMGDSEGARELLEEVLKEGGPKQKARAQELYSSLA
jgi:pilus assembly protein FimV